MVEHLARDDHRPRRSPGGLVQERATGADRSAAASHRMQARERRQRSVSPTPTKAISRVARRDHDLPGPGGMGVSRVASSPPGPPDRDPADARDRLRRASREPAPHPVCDRHGRDRRITSEEIAGLMEDPRSPIRLQATANVDTSSRERMSFRCPECHGALYRTLRYSPGDTYDPTSLAATGFTSRSRRNAR